MPNNKTELNYLNFITDIIFILDEKGKIIFANKRSAELFGESYEDKKIGDIFHENAKIIETLNVARDHGSNESTVSLIKIPDRIFQMNINFVTDIPDSKSFIITIKDITERTNIQKEYIEKYEELNVLTFNLSEGYALFTPIYSDNEEIVDFVCLDINTAALKYFETSRENIIGKNLLSFDPNAKTKGIFQVCVEVIEKGTSIEIKDYYINQKHPYTDLEVKAYKIHDDLALIFRDHTEHKKAKKDLEKTESKYKTLVNSLFEYLYSVEFENGIVVSQFHSPQCKKITGYSYSDYVNDPNLWFNMVHPDDKEMVLQYSDSRTKNKTAAPIEHRIIHKDGTLRWIANHATLTFNENGDIIRVDGLIQDITERKIAEKIIKESEEKYRILFENAVEGIFITDETGIFQDANPSGCKLLEYSAEELKTINFIDLLYKNGYTNNIPHLNFKSFMTNVEFSLLTKNGKCIFVNINSVPIKFGDKQGGLLVLRDITEKKEFEKALSDSEHKYRTVFESSPESILVTQTIDDVVIAANNKFLDLFGYRTDQIIGHNIQELNLWGDEQNHLNFVQIVNTQQEVENFRAKLFTKNKLPLSCLISTKIITYGKETARLALVQDITQILQTEEQLLLLKNAIEQSIEIVLITGVDGMIQYVNSAFERITGYSKEFAIGKNPRFLKSGKQSNDFYKNMYNTLFKGNVWTGEIVNKKKNDEFCTQEMTITPIKNEQNQISHFVAAIRDITEFRKITEEKRKLENQLFQAQKMESIGRLASGVAHDVNNMLGIILASAEMIKSTNPLDPVLTHCNNIEKTCKNTANFVKQLLLFAKQTKINPTFLDLNRLLSDTTKMLQHSLGKDIEMALNLSNAPSFIEADQIQIQQVLINLSVNARDAMPDGGILTFTVRNVYLDEEFCKIKHQILPGTYAEIIVEDSGKGIDIQNLNQIFDPFFTTKESGLGTGLGLSVVYGIISSHNGLIEVFSEPGVGTRFHIYLPLTKHQIDVMKEDELEIIYKGFETILIIDDEELILSLLQEMLTTLGYKVLSADNGLDGVQIYKEFKIDIVILDFIMPKVDGFATYKMLKAVDPNAKIIFSTGASRREKIDELQIKNENFIISKPYTVAELSKKLRKVLISDS